MTEPQEGRTSRFQKKRDLFLSLLVMLTERKDRVKLSEAQTGLVFGFRIVKELKLNYNKRV